MFQVLYKVTLYSVKISILLLYIRIFVNNTESRIFGIRANFRRVCWATIYLVLAYLVASLSATVAQCIPAAKIFNKNVPGHCINLGSFWYANGIFNVITDIIMLAMPQYQVYKLNLPIRQKLSLAAVFGVGTL